MRRYFAFLLLLFFVVPSNTLAIETVRVLIFPFEIHASQNLSYLGKDIPQAIRTYLETEGAVFIELDDPAAVGSSAAATAIDELRQIGLRAGADNVIWGSLTRIGDQMSLDVHILETVGDKPVVTIYQAGSGMENLRAIANETAEKIANQLFQRKIITQVRITGNKRIESDAIERVIRVKAGDVLRAGDLARDMKNIYKMGYFEDIRVEAEERDGGKAVIFHVQEKPTIRKISFSGNHVVKDEKLRENLNISTGSILNIFTIKSNIEQLEAMYKEKNYHNVKIDYTVEEKENNQGDIQFVIEEGKKIKIKTITFQGNTNFTDKQLKKVISTSEKGFWSWLTSSGELNREDLSQDVARLMGNYHTKGFIHAKVADPVVEFKDDWIYITFKIEEGERFKVGTIDVAGDLIRPKAELMPRLQIFTEPYFNRETVRKDVLSLTDVYADEGYAYVEIYPLTKEDTVNHLVDITYSIDKKEKVYFENIEISGNTKTRDKVIRRELRIYEQELYSSSRLKRSVRNLHRLDFFEDVKVDTPKGSAEDKMNVNIDVVEKPTGSFTFGAGYSTVDDFFITGSVSQRNLFGRGQILKFGGQIGSESDYYSLSFTEPWLFDIPLSGTASIYRSGREYDTYDRTSMGGGVGGSYPIFDYTRLSLSYRYDITDVFNIQSDASDNVKDLEGKNTTSSITTAVTYDSRDRAFNTTEGQRHRISYTYAGIGGDIGFNKIVGELGWYIPVFKGLVTFLHGESGYVREKKGYKLPDYEKFYLGGMNSMRGFDYQGINIRGTSTRIEINDDGDEEVVEYVTEEGGEKYVLFNVELTYPLLEEVGIVGVLFYDTGNVYDSDEDIDFGSLRQSAGYGIRWYSPIGPIRIEGGHILDPRGELGEDYGVNWEFSMGGTF